MTAVTPDLDQLSEQVGYLMDRTAISDLLIAFARAIDTKDWTTYASLFTDDGAIEIPVTLPDGSLAGHIGREGMAEYVEWGLGGFVFTHHLSTNHQISIHQDTADTTSYCQCVHRHNENPSDVWELGGWYKCSLRKIDSHWRFTKVHLDMVWEHGEHGPQRPPA